MESLDCGDTKLHSKVYRRDTSIFPERSKQFGLGSTSAADMLRLYKALHAGKLVSESASKQMLAHLYECDDDTMCGRDLPPGTKFAQKSGAVSAVRTNAGIIESPNGPIAICVLTADNEDQRWSSDNRALVLGGKIAREAYEYFNSQESGQAPGDPRPMSILTLRQPLFREIVGTLQHGCTVAGAGGYKRNLVWRNTNRLLHTEGYHGIKTGTTGAAGSCLVSLSTREEKSLLVVVLGSSSSDARYADTRNLYRWAWQQLGIKD